MPFKLRCSILGHSSDVRSVAATQNVIVSGSRDAISKLWTPIDFERGFKEAVCYRGHTNFVTAVCVLPASDMFPNGLVLTGSSDKSICAFDLYSSTPKYKLTGHTNTVCSLAVGRFGTIVSGSWDHTAKVWLNEKCLMTLEGHTGSVWAVALVSQSGLTITASADKTIKLWRAGKCELTFTGHTDCVRALAVLSDGSFLSASNDTTIRKWLISGVCEAVYYGHESFVYSLAVISPETLEFASVGEDRSLRVWRAGECNQVVRLPAQSVWSVAALSNGDIVTGTSDGVVRIFTCDPELQADEEELIAFEEEVSHSTLSAGEIGNIKINELPGKEVLYEPGKRDGQTKLIRNGSKVEVYQWNGADSRWIKIGDAVGSPEASGSTSKVHFEGKEYDYVFDVDIEEGRPPLKLPFNVSEDPWFAAQKFLDKHDISQMFLDQVANFIMKNTKGMSISSQPQSQYEDPFTGGTRYKPGAASVPQNTIGGSDPFTGGGRYVPGSPAIATSAKSQYFPINSILTFDSSNLGAIEGKVNDFRISYGLGCKVPEFGVQFILKLIDNSNECMDTHWEVIQLLWQWPEEYIFPVLDAVRLIIKNDSVNKRFCNDDYGKSFLNRLLEYIASYKSNSKNCMLSLRIICNMASQKSGKSLVLQHKDEIIESVAQLLPCDDKVVQIALSTVLLNFTVLSTSCDEATKEALTSHCLNVIASFLLRQLDNEARFRLLVAVGTFMMANSENIVIASSLDFSSFISTLETINDPQKLGECARDVRKMLI